MKLRFWKKEDSPKDETEISFKRETSTGGCAATEYYFIKAQTSKKALKLYDEVKKRENE